MPPSPTPSELETEFDLLLRRAQVSVPPERRAAILAGYADLREQLALLRHAARTAAAEPSNIFRVYPVTLPGTEG